MQGAVLAQQCQDWPSLVPESTFPAFWGIGIADLGFWVLSFRKEQQTQVASIFQALAVARGGSQQGDTDDAALGRPEGIQEHHWETQSEHPGGFWSLKSCSQAVFPSKSCFSRPAPPDSCITGELEVPLSEEL